MFKKVCLCSLIILVMCFTAFAAVRTVQVTLVKGEVLLKVSGTEEWRAVKEGEQLAIGNMIKTNGGASVILKFDDGSMIKLAPISVISISKMFIEEKGRATSLDIEMGKTWLRVKKITETEKFEVKTPSAVAGVRGTFFSSEVEESQKSNFDVFEGAVEVTQRDDPSKKVAVKANERTSVELGKAPVAPEKIKEDDAQKLQEGFSNEEFDAYSYDIDVILNPENVEAGQTANVTIRVLRAGKPIDKPMEVKIKLGGKAVFAGTDINEMTVTTDEKGETTLQVTDSIAERISVDVSMLIKVAK